MKRTCLIFVEERIRIYIVLPCFCHKMSMNATRWNMNNLYVWFFQYDDSIRRLGSKACVENAYMKQGVFAISTLHHSARKTEAGDCFGDRSVQQENLCAAVLAGS